MIKFFQGVAEQAGISVVVILALIVIAVLLLVGGLYCIFVLTWNFDKLYIPWSKSVLKILNFQRTLSEDSIRLYDYILNLNANLSFPTEMDKIKAFENADSSIKRNDTAYYRLESLYEKIKDYDYSFKFKQSYIPHLNVAGTLVSESGNKIDKDLVQQIFDICKEYKL